ncbi:hypothetical protein Hanom_Chr10g00959381 [Helianthus anomalus]
MNITLINGQFKTSVAKMLDFIYKIAFLFKHTNNHESTRLSCIFTILNQS